jgi:hypothetical protein
MSINNRNPDAKMAVDDIRPATYAQDESMTGESKDSIEDFEVFQQSKDGVSFRTVSWPRAAVIFLKGEHYPRFV